MLKVSSVPSALSERFALGQFGQNIDTSKRIMVNKSQKVDISIQ
jgi:hypothetical protein